MGEISHAICPCGGTLDIIAPTEAEIKENGCNGRTCCFSVLLCNKCAMRIIVILETPDC